MNGKVLIIDDEKEIGELCREILEREGYSVSFCQDGKESLKQIEKDRFNVILLDIQMSEMDGFAVLSEIKRKTNIPVVIITAFGTLENAVRALRSGASDFLIKPFSLEDLLLTVKRNLKEDIAGYTSEISRLKMIEAILELNRVIVSLTELDLLMDKVINIVNNIFRTKLTAIYVAGEEGENFVLRKYLPVKDRLPEQVPVSCRYEQVSNIFSERKIMVEKGSVRVPLMGTKKEIGFIYIEFPEMRKVSIEEIQFLEAFALQVGIGMENSILFDTVRNAYINSIKSLINSLEAKDTYTKGHSEQVAYYSLLIGKQMGIGNQNLEVLKNASYLHDLGKLGIKDSILLKPGPLTTEEMEIIKQHPVMTVKILEPLGLKKEEIGVCFHHHERINGNGYPVGLKGDDIPLLARILAVADAYSAMVSERPYRKAMREEDAIAELLRCADTQFDREIVNVFIKVLKENKREVKPDERS